MTPSFEIPSVDRKRGRRAALLVASLVAVVLSVLAWSFHEDLWAWMVGYRLLWIEPGVGIVDVNRYGEAAVYRDIPDPHAKGGEQREAGRWRASDRRFVPLPPEGWTTSGSATTEAINNKGDVVGFEIDVHSRPNGAAILWRELAAIEIEPRHGRALQPLDLNDDGHVVGLSSNPNAVASASFLGMDEEAFFWSRESGVVELNVKLGSRCSVATAINDRGWIVGWCAKSMTPQPFLYRDKVSSILNVGLPSAATATDVSDRGEVLINCLSGTDCVFVWTQDDGLRRIEPPSGHEQVMGLAIDPDGRVLLRAEAQGVECYFLLSEGDYRRLPDVTDGGETLYWNLGPNGWLAGSTIEEAEDERVSRSFVLQLYRWSALSGR